VHTDSPETSVAAAADPQPLSGFRQPPAGLRRRLVGAGLIGLAGALVPRLASVAGASTDTTTDDTTADDSPAATTTTAPPRLPTDVDVETLSFAQSVTMAAAALLDGALASGSLSDEALIIVTSVHESYVSYAQALNGFLGRKASGEPLADLLDSMSDAFAGDQDAILTAAYQLADTIVATLTEVLGTLEGTDGASLVASILIVAARQSLVFADLAGVTDLDALILTNAEAIEPVEG
jgi:hypothetical protein